jgi:hypothetical protein
VNDAALKKIERTSLVLVCAATLASLLFWDVAVLLGVALGGGLAALNFFALRRIMGAIFASSGQRQALMAVLLTLKFGVLAACIYLIVKYVPVDPTALLAGISVVVLSIFFEGARAMLGGAAAQSE